MTDTNNGRPGSAAFDLLLACSDWPTGSSRDDRIRNAHVGLAGDWTAFVQLLNRHRMTTIAVRALQGAGVDVPRDITERSVAQQRRALAMSARSIQLIDRLAKEGIDAMLLKGALLSQMLYGDPAIRHSVDIDLLVDWQNFERAIAVLESEGLQLKDRMPPFSDWRIELWRKLAKDVTLSSPDSKAVIELHHRLKTPDTLLPDLGLPQATARLRMGGTRLATFSPPDLFVYLSAHASTTLWHRLKWVTDIHVMLHGMSMDEIENWQAHSRSYGTQRCTALALLLVHNLWGREIPDTIHAEAESDKALAELFSASRERLFGPERAYTSLSNTLARRHLMQLRPDRAYHKSLMLELRHDRELLERIPLRRTLSWLYLPMRALLFLKRKLATT